MNYHFIHYGGAGLTFNFLDPYFPGNEQNHDVIKHTGKLLQELQEGNHSFKNQCETVQNNSEHKSQM